MEVEGASEAPSTLALATGGADGTGRLWSAAGRLLHTLRGHTDRLGRVAFHPMGRHLATASFDSTWCVHIRVFTEVLHFHHVSASVQCREGACSRAMTRQPFRRLVPRPSAAMCHCIKQVIYKFK